jgi:tetratricopeptide (TPR) repeat protein
VDRRFAFPYLNMKRSQTLSVAVLALVLSGPGARAQSSIDEFELALQRTRQEKPKLDPKRIINASNGFLREREPEMTAEEYALYEKVITMLETNPELAVRLLEAMMNDQQTPSPAFELILGNAYYAAGQNDRAETRFRSAVKRYPTFLRAWNNLGVLCYATGRFPDAVECLSKCVVLGDRDPATFGLLGYSLDRLGNAVSAEMAYMQALAGDPGNVDWKEGLLRLYIQGRQYGRAESLVRSLIKERPGDTRYWFSYASILLADSRKLEAMAVLEAATGSGVAGADEIGLLADLYAEQNLVAEATAAYEKLLARSPELGERKLLRYAKVLTTAGKYAEAAALLDRAQTRLSPDGLISVRLARSDLLLAQQRWPDARRELEALLKFAPLNGPALLGLGRAYLGEEDLARAQFAFESALQIPAATYEASLELANVELKNRHYEKAVEHLQKALSIEKTDAVEDYLARIKTLLPAAG